MCVLTGGGGRGPGAAAARGAARGARARAPAPRRRAAPRRGAAPAVPATVNHLVTSHISHTRVEFKCAEHCYAEQWYKVCKW